MYRECSAELAMKRVILGGGYYDDNSYRCKVIRYNPEKESIYFITEEAQLPDFSLDALYECCIHTYASFSIQTFLHPMPAGMSKSLYELNSAFESLILFYKICFQTSLSPN